MYRHIGVIALALVIGCDPGSKTREATGRESAGGPGLAPSGVGVGGIRWPSDHDAFQVTRLDSLKLRVPLCGPTVVSFTSDSVGPLRPGHTLADVLSRCPEALPMWNADREGNPEPVLLLRFGAMTLRLAMEDTLSGSRVMSLLSTDTSARTLQNVGPGSAMSVLRRAYGVAQYEEQECVVYAGFQSAPGLVFQLDFGDGEFECGTLEGLSDTGWEPAPNVPVAEMFIYLRPPAEAAASRKEAALSPVGVASSDLLCLRDSLRGAADTLRYSSVSTHEETGDLLGIDLRLTRLGARWTGTAAVAQGALSAPTIFAKAQLDESRGALALEWTQYGRPATFRGTLTCGAIVGQFRWTEMGETERDSLPRHTRGTSLP